MKKRTKFSIFREKSGMSIHECAILMNRSERTIYRWESGESNPSITNLKKIEEISESRNNKMNTQSDFTFIDLFAGIGGLRRGFESIGGKCVFTSEWDKFCRQTYQANFHCNHAVDGDIRDIEVDQIPEFDLLLAGFPCQPFSIAGVSKKRSLGNPEGFRDETQGTLFFDVARIIEYHRPKAFLLENVKNLIGHDKGRTFKVILRTLEKELGYKVDYKVINGKGWVPQNRERIFIVGFREDVGFSFDNFITKDPLKGPKLNSILHPEDNTETPEDPYTDSSGNVVDKYTLSDKLWSYLQKYAEKHRKKGNGFGFGLNEPTDVARTLSARYYKDGSEILIKQENKNPRRLTPRECARLMGFDKPNESKFVIPVSDTQAYKQFGNSVIVPVVEDIAKYMSQYIEISIDKSKETNKEDIQMSLML